MIQQFELRDSEDVKQTMQTITMKFGGTSVGSGDAITQVVRIIQHAREYDAENVIVIVSAMSKVTDLLQEGIRSAASSDSERYRQIAVELRAKHEEAARQLLLSGLAILKPPAAEAEFNALLVEVASFLEDYRRICESVRVLGEATPRALDYTMGLGERMSARLVAAALRRSGTQAQAIDATQLIVTDDTFQSAVPLFGETRIKVQAALAPLLANGIVPVVTGFIGATRDGVSTTLGRGGSDYSAAILGTCIDSDEVWIWTDVDGIMSTDPRIVPEARIIDTLTYREISELAYFGAKVLHPKTIRPVLEASIPLRVKNTFNSEHPGTLIVGNDYETEHRIKAVTAIRDVSLLTVEGKGMLGVPGIAARTFGAVARTGTSVLMISQSSSEQSICFVVPNNGLREITGALNAEFALEIARRDIDEVVVQEDVAIITVVGAGTREVPGIAGRIFTATGECGVNVIVIAQGSSECSISLVVTADDADLALRAIHPLTLTT